MRARVETTVCDIGCGKVATESFTWKMKSGRSTTNDFCEQHYKMLQDRGHIPRRGYRPGRVRGAAATRKPISAVKSTEKSTKSTAKKPTAKRRKPRKLKAVAA